MNRIDKMSLITLVCASLLVLEGVSPYDEDEDPLFHFRASLGQYSVYVYSRPGEDILIPCDAMINHGPGCHMVDWTYLKRSSLKYIGVASRGEAYGSRVRLNSNCSLTLLNTTEEDPGNFVCQLHGFIDYEPTVVYLSIITVSLSPDSNSSQSGNVTIECKLEKYHNDPCEDDNFHWLDQEKKVLSGVRKNCVSYLTVQRQSQHNRTFTCQYVESSQVMVSAHYKLEGCVDFSGAGA